MVKSPRGARANAPASRSVRICAAPHAAFRKLGGEGGGVLLHLRSTAYFRLNALGAIVWEIAQQPVSFEALVTRVRALVDDPPPSLEDDIGRFVDELTSRDLVVVERIN